MTFILNFIDEFLKLANAMSLYILIGLLLAGILKEFLSDDFITKHLGKSDFLSVIKATVLGIPLPVCSCSVIPLAKSLQKEGASRGAVQSFLISSPITGVDSILATYSFFGWFFTIYRVVTSIFIAIFTGILQNIFDAKEISKTKKNFSQSCCSGGCCSTKKANSGFSIKRVFDYAFNTLFKDMAKSLFVGLLIGSLVTVLLPKEILSSFNNNSLLLYILVLLISMPMYVCATSSLPIGASLLMSGLPVGAVFVFLSAGPATNSVTMSVVKDMFGKKAFFIYILSIAIWSIFFGFLFDTFLPNIFVQSGMMENSDFSVINIVSTAIMIGMMFYYMWRR
jgi:uncharacterized membrane protein YraQ (UPF0718 family)